MIFLLLITYCQSSQINLEGFYKKVIDSKKEFNRRNWLDHLFRRRIMKKRNRQYDFVILCLTMLIETKGINPKFFEEQSKKLSNWRVKYKAEGPRRFLISIRDRRGIIGSIIFVEKISDDIGVSFFSDKYVEFMDCSGVFKNIKCDDDEQIFQAYYFGYRKIK